MLIIVRRIDKAMGSFLKHEELNSLDPNLLSHRLDGVLLEINKEYALA